jgi:hypothetical protein
MSTMGLEHAQSFQDGFSAHFHCTQYRHNAFPYGERAAARSSALGLDVHLHLKQIADEVIE